MRVCLAILLFVALAGAQTAPQKPATPKTSPKSGAGSSRSSAGVDPDEGSVENGVYTSDYFHFSYTLPEGFEVDEDFIGAEEDQSNTSFVLLAAQGPLSGEDRRDMVVIMADREATTAEAYVAKVQRDYAQKQGFEILKSAYPVTLGGKPFYRADFRKEGTYQTAVFTILKGYAVGFTIAAPNGDEMNTLLASLDSVKFTGPKPPGTAPKPSPPPAKQPPQPQ
jgi:predicted nucleic acid-binding Zn ribbon protein